MLILHSKIDTMSGRMETGLRDLRTTIAKDLSEFRRKINPMTKCLMGVQSKQAQSQRILTTALSLVAGSLKLVTEGTFETHLRLPDEHDLASSGDKSTSNTDGAIGTTTSDVLADSLSRVTGMTDTMLNSGSDPPACSVPSTSTPSTSDQFKSSSGTAARPPAGSATPPEKFVLESNHTTVAQLWKEWHQGIFGRKSVVAMVRQGYKKSEGQRKLYSRRKLVMDEVARLAAMRVEPESEVVKAMDEYTSLHKMSITKLQDLIRKRSQDGEELEFWLVTE
ncbi:hypothetical protein QFC21_000714 [Naganishia friedmannii]|uniref:Uncharacterized protein n=1 Tax=Naganishia friedmannii TaxID=89922 RepID=A0ACC2W9J0_9TREE|nr:hypothetical protein QFC21_000714 [Naganishia friedmannii]